MAGLASADAPASAPFVGRRELSSAATPALFPPCAVVDITALAVLKGIPTFAEVVSTAQAAPARRPRRFLIAPVLAEARRRPARVCGRSP